MLCGVTAAVYGTMLAWTVPTIAAHAGGLQAFDLRPAGYTLEEARAFLIALGPDGARFYLDVQQRLDLVFPVLITATLSWSIARLAPPELGRRRWWLASLAVPIAPLDYLENAGVTQLLELGSERISAEMVAEASRWTVLKSGFVAIAAVPLLALLSMRGWRRWKRGRAAAG